MRYREYDLPISYYHISILNGHPESARASFDMMCGSKISFSSLDQIEYPFYMSDRRKRLSIEDIADMAIENDESYFFRERTPEEREYKLFFSRHYKEIFCGKHPEWVAYDINILCCGSGFCISFVNTKTLDWPNPVECWLINSDAAVFAFQVNVSHPNRPVEKYILSYGAVAELEGQTWRRYEFYKKYKNEEDEAKGDYNYTQMATVEEYALL